MSLINYAQNIIPSLKTDKYKGNQNKNNYKNSRVVVRGKVSGRL
jgi:hypothetical protein